MDKKLYRSKKDKKIFGVCAGVAKYFDIDATVIRLIWALLILFCGTGILAYLVCALVMPDEPDDYIDQDGVYYTPDIKE